METTKDKDFPGIELAYEWVRPSFDWMLQRLEAATTRIQHVQAFAATLTFAAPVVVKASFPSASPSSPWLWAALALFLIIVGIGLWASVSGTVKLADPIKIRERLVRKEGFQFRADLLLTAANASEHNASLVGSRAKAAIAMTALVAFEVVCLVMWALGA